uniref:fibronectin type III domain-containing protein n=1 Tax=Eubacterium sp. TaxID=142586 RepID=UPI004025CBD9
MKKIFSLLLSFVMLISIVSLVDFSAFAASKLPATSITSLSAKDNGFTVKWKKKTKITGYQIQYSTSSKFSMKNTKTVKIKKAKTASKKITDLKSSKKYYVRIRTYKIVKKKKSYSSWSKKKNVTTKNCEHCTNNNNHSIKCGNIGMWFGSRREVDTYFSSVCNTWGTKYKNEEITWEEYTKNCPQGYECWSCSYCGKWTGNFIY